MSLPAAWLGTSGGGLSLDPGCKKDSAVCDTFKENNATIGKARHLKDILCNL